MSFDNYFSSSFVAPIDRKAKLKPRQSMSDLERLLLVEWVETMPNAIGGWSASFDFTFGSGDWPGRRPGKRRDRRDLLVSSRKRGFDADDALQCFKLFMDRVAHHVTWFASAEPNPDHTGLNPGFHGHAVLAGTDDVHRNTLQKLWLEENGFAKVLPLRSKSAAIHYTTKHVVRRGAIYAWKVNSSTLWHHIKEHSSETIFSPEQLRAFVPSGCCDGRAVVRDISGRDALPLSRTGSLNSSSRVRPTERTGV